MIVIFLIVEFYLIRIIFSVSFFILAYEFKSNLTFLKLTFLKIGIHSFIEKSNTKL